MHAIDPYFSVLENVSCSESWRQGDQSNDKHFIDMQCAGPGQIIFFDVQLSVALMSGALGMIVTRVLSIDEAYRAVDWMTVFLLAGLIPLGLAFQETGTAAFIAHGILQLVGTPSPIVLLAIIGILTSNEDFAKFAIFAVIVVYPFTFLLEHMREQN